MNSLINSDKSIFNQATLPIFHLCKKKIDEAYVHQDFLHPLDIAPVPQNFVFDQTVNIKNLPFFRSESIKHLMAEGWTVVNKAEEKITKYRKIKTAPNKNDYLLML